MAPGDWDDLRAQTRTIVDVLGRADCLDSPAEDIFSWFEADVTVDGESLARAGIRKKGFPRIAEHGEAGPQGPL